MKSLLIACAMAFASFAQANTITREFNIQTLNSGSLSYVGADTENVSFWETGGDVTGHVTEGGNIETNLRSVYEGNASTSAVWSNTFVSAGTAEYVASLSFAQTTVGLSFSYLGPNPDLDTSYATGPRSGNFSSGYRWSLYANNNLVWSSGVEVRADNGGTAYVLKTGFDLGGVFEQGVRPYSDGNTAELVEYGTFRNEALQYGAILGTFAEGATVEVRYVLDTYTNSNGYYSASCGGECWGTAVNVGDPVQIDGVQHSITIAPAVPEPETYALFGLGLLGVAVARRRKNA